LRSAARRLYTEDGTLILDVQDLITWSIEYYRKEYYKVNNKDQSDHEEATLNKSFPVPSRKEIKRLLDDFDVSYKVDSKKLFKWPIEIWISQGEAFISPRLVSKLETERLNQREQRDRVEHELEKQKHTLRHMIGRRLNARNPGELKSIKNPEIPVMKEGHWSEVTFDEQVKQIEVNNLKNYVDKMPKSASNSNSRAKSSFGTYPVTVRLFFSKSFFFYQKHLIKFEYFKETCFDLFERRIIGQSSILFCCQF
jgi:hypothetical protein